MKDIKLHKRHHRNEKSCDMDHSDQRRPCSGSIRPNGDLAVDLLFVIRRGRVQYMSSSSRDSLDLGATGIYRRSPTQESQRRTVFFHTMYEIIPMHLPHSLKDRRSEGCRGVTAVTNKEDSSHHSDVDQGSTLR